MTAQDVSIFWGVRIPMRDGVHVVADLYMPSSTANCLKFEDMGVLESGSMPETHLVPAIVVRTPYGRSTDGNVEQGRYFASHGYAYVVVDVRGRGDSEGTFVPYRGEGKDGYDTIEWLAQRPWCTGDVGTFGGSYLGRVQWLTALEQPPHLKAMIPIVSPSDPFVEWPTGTPDPMHVCWLFMVSDRVVQNVNRVDWEKVYSHLPMVTMDEAAGRMMPTWKEKFEHCYLDDWWKEICYQNRFSEIDLPIMHISGWYDDEQIGTPLNFSGMAQHAPTKFSRHSQRLIMGPWGHHVNESTKVGSLDFGPGAVIDLRKRQLEFFDKWLKHEDNGEDTASPVSLFVMGTNVWRNEQEWPLARTVYTPWYLQSKGCANGSAGGGQLSLSRPESAEEPDTYAYDPRTPVPFITEPTSSQIGGPDDYQEVHLREDVLVYTSPPLSEALEVTGPVKMQLYAKTDAPDTDFMAMLHDVHPDGYVQRLCDGMVRVRFRKGMDAPELLEPGTIYPYEIDCWNTSHVFLPGHRIRVHITSSAFPKYDRNPNTDLPLGVHDEMRTALQTVLHDTDHPSHILLPVIPSRD